MKVSVDLIHNFKNEDKLNIKSGDISKLASMNNIKSSILIVNSFGSRNADSLVTDK